jgi:phage terminase small subunit
MAHLSKEKKQFAQEFVDNGGNVSAATKAVRPHLGNQAAYVQGTRFLASQALQTYIMRKLVEADAVDVGLSTLAEVATTAIESPSARVSAAAKLIDVAQKVTTVAARDINIDNREQHIHFEGLSDEQLKYIVERGEVPEDVEV